MIARPSSRPRSTSVAAWVSTALRLGLAGVLIAAGGLKAIDPQASVAAVRAYEILPAGAENAVGWGLPFLEIALGLLLAVGAGTRVVAVATAGLFAVFIAAVSSAWGRGLSIDCGCFGGGGTVATGQPDYTGEILRDTLFLLAAVWLVRQPRSKLALDTPPSSPRPVPAARSPFSAGADDRE